MTNTKPAETLIDELATQIDETDYAPGMEEAEPRIRKLIAQIETATSMWATNESNYLREKLSMVKWFADMFFANENYHGGPDALLREMQIHCLKVKHGLEIHKKKV